MQKKFEVHNVHTTINKVEKAEIDFCPIVRVPIRNQQEADTYRAKGVAIYEKITETSRGKSRYFFIEVSVYDLAEVARKN